MLKKLCLIWLLISFSGIVQAQEQNEWKPREKWAKYIERFARSDEKNGYLDGGIFFVGSSSILMWNLENSFPGIPTRNRGFGGSRFRDLDALYEDLFAEHKPDAIVVYCGENDLGGHKATVEEVWELWSSFYKRVRADYPEAEVVFIGFKRAPRRYEIWTEMRKGNELFEQELAKDDKAHFINGDEGLLNHFGIADLAFYNDGLHLNKYGYAVWTPKVLQGAQNGNSRDNRVNRPSP